MNRATLVSGTALKARQIIPCDRKIARGIRKFAAISGRWLLEQDSNLRPID
jgi:hypothetical protein